MKILIIPNNTTNNCYGVRNKLPGEYLRERGHEVRFVNEFKGYMNVRFGTKAIDPTDIDWCDTVVFNRHYDIDPGTIRNLMLYAKANGKKVIYETDDLLTSVDPANPAYTEVSKNIKQVVVMASHADICTTTGQALKNQLLNLNSRVEVLPNCMDEKQWTVRKGGNQKVRVGWAGGSSHAKDLLLIIDVIKDLKKEIDFEFVIFGLVPKNWNEYIVDLKAKFDQQRQEKITALKNIGEDFIKPAQWVSKMIELDESLKGLEWTHQPFVPLKEYNKKLADLNLDIGLCPLEDTKFDNCKSAIKFYEYAMVGTTTLASDVTPYKEEVNYLAKNRYDKWHKKLKKLITDKELRDMIVEEQRKYVLENREIGKNIHRWEEVYSKFL